MRHGDLSDRSVQRRYVADDEVRYDVKHGEVTEVYPPSVTELRPRRVH